MLKFASAISYNKEGANRLWSQDDLPDPFCIRTIPKGAFATLDAPFCWPSDSGEFVAMVSIFQRAHGLRVDGKLGPSTLAAMRSVKARRESSEAAHDFEAEGQTTKVPRKMKPRIGVSNRIVIDGKAISLPNEMVSRGITASNYIDDGEHQFDEYKEREKVRFLVIHESVSMCAAETNRILKLKSMRTKHAYGIHLNLHPDGHISCHADVVRHRLVHAMQANDEGFGIEVVNPYNPMFARPPFDRVIPGPWWCWKPEGAPKLYTVPTDAQLLSLSLLVKFLAEKIGSLPLAFPTKHLSADKRRIDGWEDGALPDSGGIVAHRDFTAHSGGRYLLEYCIEQMNKPLHARS